MILQKNFSDQELAQIIEEGGIYMCACPAQVAVQLRSLRELFRYQTDCGIEPGNDQAVHQAIGMAAFEAHALMEVCLERILALEGWDRATLRMPEGLRRKRDSLVNDDDPA